MKKNAANDSRGGYIRCAEAAQYLGVSRRWLYILREKNLIPYYKRGRIVAFRIADLDRYMARFRVNATWEHK